MKYKTSRLKLTVITLLSMVASVLAYYFTQPALKYNGLRDLGTVEAGKIVGSRIQLVNQTFHKMVIDEANVSCSCISIDTALPLQIPPLGKGEISFHAKIGQKPGRFNQKIILLNGKDKSIINLYALVSPLGNLDIAPRLSLPVQIENKIVTGVGAAFSITSAGPPPIINYPVKDVEVKLKRSEPVDVPWAKGKLVRAWYEVKYLSSTTVFPIFRLVQNLESQSISLEPTLQRSDVQQAVDLVFFGTQELSIEGKKVITCKLPVYFANYSHLTPDMCSKWNQESDGVLCSLFMQQDDAAGIYGLQKFATPEGVEVNLRIIDRSSVFSKL